MMKKLIKYITLLLPLYIYSNSVFSKENFTDVTEFVSKIKKDLDFPSGTAIAIVKDGKIIYQQNFGYADINAQKKVNNETAFYIASSTKPFFALSALLMAEKGDISEKTPLSEMFPNSSFKHFDATKVNLKHLLSHTSGLENKDLITATAYTGLHDNKLRHKLISATKPIKDKKLNDFHYTNIGYNMVSVWFDNYYRQEWQKTLSKSVFEPLEMNNTSAYMSYARKKGITVAKPYDILNSHPREPLYLSKHDNTMHAAGGMISTSSDLSRFLIAQLNNGVVAGKQVFSKNIIRKSHEKIAIFPATQDTPEEGYGWGWDISTYKGEVMYKHLGGFSGSHAHISFMPEKNIGLVVLNNQNYVDRDITEGISDLVYSQLLNNGDVVEKKVALLDEINKKFVKISSLVKQDKIKKAKRKFDLSLMKQSYIGIFKHDLLGRVKIELTPSMEYKISWGNLNAELTPYKNKYKDFMRSELVPGRGWKLEFLIENEVVTGLIVENTQFSKEL